MRAARVFKYKQVIAVRVDIQMSSGKLATQVAHGSIAAAEVARREHRNWFDAWLHEGQKKAVVRAADAGELRELQKRAKELGVPAGLIEDAGLTELPPGTVTVLAVGPAPAELVDSITGRLPLL